MVKQRVLTVLGVLLLLFALPLVVEASTFEIPQGMDFVVFVRNLPEVARLLAAEWSQSDEFEGVGDLPTQVVLFGKASVDLEKLDLTGLMDYGLDNTVLALKDWSVVFVLPANTSEELVENFLWFVGLVNPRFEQVSNNYWRVSNFLDSGVLLKTESGIYVTFSKVLERYLELSFEDKTLSVSVEMPDEPLISYRFLNESPIGSLLYLLGDAFGRPKQEMGTIAMGSDGSFELKVKIFKELSDLEKRMSVTQRSIDDHVYLADANFYLSSTGFLTPLLVTILKQAFPLTFTIDGLESFALSAHMTDDGDVSSAALCLKFGKEQLVNALNSVRNMLFWASVEEIDGTIVVKMGEGELVRIGDILPRNTKLHLALPFFALYLNDESPEITNVHFKIPSLENLLELVGSNVDVSVSEWDSEEEDWVWGEEPDEWDEYTEEPTGDSSTEWTLDETELWVSELTENMAEFVSSYVWTVAEGEEPDAAALSEEVGLPEDSFDVLKNITRDGTVHMIFVFYLEEPDQVYEAFEHLTDLLELPWNASVTLTYSGTKFIVYVTLEQY